MDPGQAFEPGFQQQQQQQQQQPCQGQQLPFYNVQPRTREERAAVLDNTAMEKSRIAARSSRSEAPPANVLLPPINCPSYTSEHNRFADRDAAAAEHTRRLDLLKKKENMYEARRVQGYRRSNKAWEQNINAHDRVEQMYNNKRDAGEGGVRRGKSSECYNIMTLEYEQSPKGQALQYKDMATHYKGQLRSLYLYGKGHSVPHNIITGEQRWEPPVPSRPTPPWAQQQQQ